MSKRLFIIDGYNHIHRAFFAPMGIELTSPSGEPTTATYVFSTFLVGLIQKQRPDMLIVAMEGGGPIFRTKLYGEYKANRSPMCDNLAIQIERIKEILNTMNIPVLRVDGYEADDIIGTVAKRAAADGYEVFICSNDKDMFQLLQRNVKIFDMKTGDCIDSDKMVEQIGVGPDKFVDYLALQGDPTDNVPGIPGVGSKTALKWILEYGSIENLIDHTDEIKNKRGDSLREFKDMLLLSKKLVTIDCDVPTEVDFNNMVVKKFDRDKLREIFIELGFSRLITHLGLDKAE